MNIKVSRTDRRTAHRYLDQWLNDCERESASAFARGRAGHLGECKITAVATDDGVLLTIERSLQESL